MPENDKKMSYDIIITATTAIFCETWNDVIHKIFSNVLVYTKQGRNRYIKPPPFFLHGAELKAIGLICLMPTLDAITEICINLIQIS